MPNCCIIGCKSTSRTPNAKLFTFPKIDKRSEKCRELSAKRLQCWIEILKKRITTGVKNLKICHLHFISGVKPKLIDVNNPDWIPSQNLQLDYGFGVPIVPDSKMKTENSFSQIYDLEADDAGEGYDDDGVDDVKMVPTKFEDYSAFRPSNIAMSSCKYCFVKSCNSNSKRNPDKYFFRVPYNKDLRRKWCLAVGRDPVGLNYASSAFCCCDHFDMEVDLNRIATNSKSVPILKSDVVPSMKVQNNQKFIVKANNERNTPRDSATKNLFVREVVYIEENDNDRFLEETNEVEDTLNMEPDWNGNELMAEDVIEILDDEKFVEHIPTTKKTAETKPDKIVLQKNKNKQCETLKDAPKKPLILRHITQFHSVGRQDAVKFVPVRTQMPASPAIPMPVKIQSNQTKKKLLPKATALPSVSIASPKFVVVDAVNKWKYLNVNEKSRNERKEQKDLPQSDDDDCVVVEEQNELSKVEEAVTETHNTNSTRKILTTLPSSISVKCTGNGRKTLAQPSKPTPEEIRRQAALNECSELVPFQTKSGKISDVPNVNEHKVFTLIKLMISENQLLLARNKGNIVKIARTKPNEFRIMDNIYYYRTNDEFEKNYFFMNITRQSSNIKEVILRSYGIYWGNPRRSCVGVVETKGILDEGTKDFVFQQVKKSLLQESARMNSGGPSSIVLSIPPVQRYLDTHQIRNNLVGIKSMKMPSIRKRDDGLENGTVVVKYDDEKKLVLQSSAAVQQRFIKKIAIQSPVAISKATLEAFRKHSTVKRLSSPLSNAIQSPVATSKATLEPFPMDSTVKKLSSPVNNAIQSAVATSEATLEPFGIHSTIKKLSTPVNKPATVTKLSSPVNRRATTKKTSLSNKRTVTAKAPPGKKKIPTKISRVQDEAIANGELIRLSQFLTPTIRSLINKLKYFQLDGKVYSVKVGDSVAKEKPFNIVFHEKEPEHLAELNIRPVSTLLYVSKLVSYLFQAIYPYMTNRNREPIPILPPQDIISDATPEVMEALLISESKRTYEEIGNVEASVNNSNTELSTTDFKHKCHICSQAFARKYQLKRHQFVTHDSEHVKMSTESNASSNANILKAIPDTIRKAFEDIRTESGSSDLLLTTTIKTEKPEETIVSDRSLLVPLYEELINEVRDHRLGNLPLGKFKQEPEEHFEDTSSDEPKQDSKKRKLQQTNCGNADETDSATESVELKSSNVKRKRKTTLNKKRTSTLKMKHITTLNKKRTAKLNKTRTYKQQKQEKLKRLEKVRNDAIKRKIMRSQIIDRQEMVPVTPIQISRPNDMIQPLTVDLVDIKSEQN